MGEDFDPPPCFHIPNLMTQQSGILHSDLLAVLRRGLSYIHPPPIHAGFQGFFFL